uniref:Fungal lipase-type domain-containing protein n=1 Tax=Picea sitchensis TaxID=3332 RepID=B8LKB6_PICSI|nr:unknown [Picea sitchensis]
MSTVNYLIANTGRICISKLLFSPGELRSDVLECPESIRLEVNETWKIRLSLILIKLMKDAALPLAKLGTWIEFYLNLLSQNGGLLKTLFRRLTGRSIVIPSSGSETFLSFIGFMEHRVNLYDGGTGGVIDSTIEPGNRFYADLCVMASTVAYENKLVIRDRVTEHWKMHFVEFLDCWNDHLQKKSTQAFIFSDKEVDAQLVVIAFRGTEPFDADDWETDFDFSWYQFSQIGKVHLGFLEALGLANRSEKSEIFDNHSNSAFSSCVPSFDIDKEDPEKPLAYYALRKKLKELLQVHSNAKFMVTGHSLGGALAVLFPAILFMHKEETLLEKMLGVYTFGQPRVGDEDFAKFMNKNLNEPLPRYFRIVYSNDIVPRMPFDDHIFQYKHFGVCLYYNSCYNEKNLQEEPNRNFSLLHFIPIRITAVWELVQSLFLQYTKGREFKETKLSIFFRILGLMIPGVSAHSPVNYINAVRLGPSTLNPTMYTPPHLDRED